MQNKMGNKTIDDKVKSTFLQKARNKLATYGTALFLAVGGVGGVQSCGDEGDTYIYENGGNGEEGNGHLIFKSLNEQCVESCASVTTQDSIYGSTCLKNVYVPEHDEYRDCNCNCNNEGSVEICRQGEVCWFVTKRLYSGYWCADPSHCK